jgi:polar amino acid transport system permease protein
VIIYMGYYGLAGDPINAKLDILQAAVLSLAVFYAAYLSEIFRAALVGVHHGQREAAQALGLSRMTTFGSVIFPQGVRLALAGTNTMMVDMLKSSSLLVIISAAELFQVGKSASSATFQTMEVMIVIAAIYFAMCYPLSQGLLWLERRMHAGAPLSPRRARRLRKARAMLGVPQTGTAS